MICQIRLENKLLNGNITDEQARAADARMILAVHDETADQPLMKKALASQVNPDFKFELRHVEEAIRLLKDPRAKTLSVMIICKCPQDILTFVRAFPDLTVVVGKYKSKSETTIKLSDHWIITKEEKPLFDQIAASAKLIHQLLPTRPQLSYLSLLEKATHVTGGIDYDSTITN